MSSGEKIPVWLDCDPGHDDAFAILLATHSTKIDLLGISIVHGNDSVDHCAQNALRMMWVCGISGIKVYKGIQTPLIRNPKFCPEIHGVAGEQGVAGMCGYHFPDDEIFTGDQYKCEEKSGVLAMVEAIKNHTKNVTVVLTGAQTNFAIALRMFPEIKNKVDKVVFMGGAIGLGNTGVAAEFNIQTDPEAASIVFHSGLKLVMVPLEVTHKVLVTKEILSKLANVDNENFAKNVMKCDEFTSSQLPHRHVEYSELSQSIHRRHRMDNPAQLETTEIFNFSSTFAHCCYKLLTFFQTTYCKEFGFSSPPLHDPCTIFFLTNPEAFQTLDLYVDVETSSDKCAGRTLCDVNNLTKQPPNVAVCTDIVVNQFWDNLLTCVQQAASQSPMNRKQ